MSFNKYQEPNKIALKNSENYVTALSEDTQSYSDFMYDVDVNILVNNPNTMSILNTIKLRQMPNPNSFFVFNFNSYVDQLEYNANISDLFYFNQFSYNKMNLDVYEYSLFGYNGRNEGTKISTDPIYLLNGNEDIDKEEFDYLDYTLTSDSKKFLTDFEGNRIIYDDSIIPLSILNEEVVEYIYLKVDFKEKQHNRFNIAAFDSLIIKIETGFLNFLRYDLNISFDNINSKTKTIVASINNGISTSQNEVIGAVLDDKIKCFSVYSGDNLGNVTSKSYKYVYKDRLETYGREKYNLIWINRFGGLEGFVFNGYSRKRIRKNSENYKAIKNTVSSETGFLTKSRNSRNHKTLYRDIKFRLELETGYIDRENDVIMEDLMKSDSVWLVKGGDLVPIMLTDSELDLNDSGAIGLKNYDIKFEYDIDVKYNNL